LVKRVLALTSAFHGRNSGCVEDAESEQIEVGASVHLPFDQFQAVDVAFDWTVVLWQTQSRQHCILIADEVGGEVSQGSGLHG